MSEEAYMVEKNKCAEDLLNRESFVRQVVYIIENLSRQKRNACYAINGKWGVGKTFVLKMVEEQIKVIQQNDAKTNKYVVFGSFIKEALKNGH